MSRNRIKSLDFDDDDYYDEDEYDDGGGEGEGIYDGSEEMSVEDRERMRLGTLEVKELLSLLEPPVAVSNTEIQEALWNYYWDVDQSVDYLKSMDFSLVRMGLLTMYRKENSRTEEAAQENPQGYK